MTNAYFELSKTSSGAGKFQFQFNNSGINFFGIQIESALIFRSKLFHFVSDLEQMSRLTFVFDSQAFHDKLLQNIRFDVESLTYATPT